MGWIPRPKEGLRFTTLAACLVLCCQGRHISVPRYPLVSLGQSGDINCVTENMAYGFHALDVLWCLRSGWKESGITLLLTEVLRQGTPSPVSSSIPGPTPEISESFVLSYHIHFQTLRGICFPPKHSHLRQIQSICLERQFFAYFTWHHISF